MPVVHKLFPIVFVLPPFKLLLLLLLLLVLLLMRRRLKIAYYRPFCSKLLNGSDAETC